MKTGVEPNLAEGVAVEKRRVDADSAPKRCSGGVDNVGTIVKRLSHSHYKAFFSVLVSKSDAVGFGFALETHHLDRYLVSISQKV